MIGASEVTIAMLYSTSSLQRAMFGLRPITHFSRKTFTTFAMSRSDSSKLSASAGIITFNSKFPLAAHHVAAEWQFFDRGDGVAGAQAGVFNLLRVAPEFLTEPHRRGVHEVCAADLDHVPEFQRLLL